MSEHLKVTLKAIPSDVQEQITRNLELGRAHHYCGDRPGHLWRVGRLRCECGAITVAVETSMTTYRVFRLGLFCILGNLLLLRAVVSPFTPMDRLEIVGVALVIVAAGVGIEFADRLSDWAQRKSEFKPADPAGPTR